MKKILFSMAVMLCINVTAQQNDVKPFIVQHCIDKMTDKEYYLPKANLVPSNEKKTKGVIISPNFEYKNDNIVLDNLLCTVVNIGTCNESDELIILFEDDTKISLVAYNKFNCEGNAFFSLSQTDQEMLSTKKLSALRFINKRSFESFNYTFKLAEKDYFIRAYNNYKVIEINCD